MSDLFEQLQEQAKRRPKAVALWERRGVGGRTATTFAQLAESARQCANQFHHFAPDASIIPLLLGKSAECVAAMFGAIGAGKAFACLNRKLRSPQINRILQSILDQTGAATALVDGPGVMTLSAVMDSQSPIARTRWRVIGGPSLLGPHRAAIEKMRGFVDISEWQAGDGPIAASALTKDPLRPGCCLFTSGSTGTPKGVLIAEAELLERAREEADWFGLAPGDVLLSILPFSFDVGLNQLLAAVVAGCSLVLLDSWLPADILNAAEQFKVTGISGVPAIWADMMSAGMAFDTRGRHAPLRFITLSGGDLPPPQLDRLPSIAPGVGIFKTYGQSEDFRSSSLRPEEFATRSRSVGRPFPGARIYVVCEDGSSCRPREEGEIVHTGLGTMLRYLDGHDPDHKLRPNPFHCETDPAKLAVFTGDLGYLDEDGYLYVNGRRDAMLKIAGNRVYPAEIVEQAMQITGVREAEVVSAKSPDGQTHIFAFIVLTDEVKEIKTAALRLELSTRLPSYMVPREVILLEAIPRTASGKPDRPALIDRATTILRSSGGAASATPQKI